MQPIKDIEESYKTPDPWGFTSHPDDAFRKEKILEVLKQYQPKNKKQILPFEKALDIGCGEGWITKDLPAKILHGYEVSKNAQMRFPKNVVAIDAPKESYDLVVATGVLYTQYDYKHFLDVIKKCATNIVLTCNIQNLEMPEVSKIGQQVHSVTFPYREYTQILRVFQI